MPITRLDEVQYRIYVILKDMELEKEIPKEYINDILSKATEILKRVNLEDKRFKYMDIDAVALAVLYVAVKYSCFSTKMLLKILNYKRRSVYVSPNLVKRLAREIEQTLGLNITTWREACLEKLERVCRQFDYDVESVKKLYFEALSRGLMPPSALMYALDRGTKITKIDIAKMLGGTYSCLRAVREKVLKSSE